ncbi:MAG: aldehyde dehydrogenase family protein [Haliea sp.]
MRTGLLLVDLQNDFLRRPGLLPGLAELQSPVAGVLAFARAAGMPVAHIRTRVEPDGSDSMPHWRRAGILECVAGTPGEMAPVQFAALDNEPVFRKRFFSGFGNPELEPWLRQNDVSTLWVAGVYTHGCIRATVMDAYERGFEVIVVEDGVASTEPLHARITRDYLHGRAAQFVPGRELWGEKPPADDAIDATVLAALAAGSDWRRRPLVDRRALLARLEPQLATAAAEVLQQLISTLGKPRRDAADELSRARGHLAVALSLQDEEALAPGVTVHYLPHGVVCLVTPWNNPLAIPLGKLVAALMFGNSVIWKPAPRAYAIAEWLQRSLLQCGLAPGLVQLVPGGPEEVAQLAGHPDIAAVSLTGSVQAGRAVAAICALTGKPLQAELGGNNAMLVLADARLEAQVPVWARMAFGFAGQRCTALRRFVVEREVAPRFISLMLDAIADLQLRDPDSENCVVGPMISSAGMAKVAAAVAAAQGRGARVLVGGQPLENLPGHYFPPTLVTDLSPDDPLVQEELFGPVAVVQLADDFEHGMALVNGVAQGLLAAIATTSLDRQQAFARRAEAGILATGEGLRIHPAAPFGGFKESQLGPPEHGVWDREFFSRVQVRYTEAE